MNSDNDRVSLKTILRRVHEDEDGQVSLETILVIGLIALPVLIFLYKVGWPMIKGYFMTGMEELEESRDDFIEP
jgi:hypothetical protein